MKKTPLRLLLTLLIVFTLAACKKSKGPAPLIITPPPDLGFKVVGYFPSYRDPLAVPDVKFRMTNVVNWAFGTVKADGTLIIDNFTVFNQLVAKAKANNAKVFLSISGSHADFSSMASAVSSRNYFIKGVMNAMRNHQLNGADIDWEFPRTTDGTDVSFTKLMKELSDSLHYGARYYLTAAITAGKYAGAVRDAIQREVFDYADWFNIMSYDDFSTTVPYKHHSDLTLAQTSMNYWVNTRSMPRNKAVLGIPAYGRPSGITQTGTVLTYAQILNQTGSASAQTDSAIVLVGSAWPTPYTIYYNGQPTVKKKAALAKSMGAGVMMWEKGQDTHDGTSLLKAVCDEIGRAY